MSPLSGNFENTGSHRLYLGNVVNIQMTAGKFKILRFCKLANSF
jgi:hypothetical protein